MTVGNHRLDGHGQCILDLTQQCGEIGFPGAIETAGEQDLPREAITQHPEDILVFVRLEPVNGQDDVPVLDEPLVQPGVVSKMHSKQFFVACQQISDRAQRDGDVLGTQRLMNFHDRAVLTIAEHADVRNDVQAKLAMRQGPGTRFLGTVGLMVTRTGRIGAAHDG